MGRMGSTPSPNLRAEIATAALLRRTRLARKSRADFFEFVWADARGQPVTLAPFQRKWIEALDANDRVFVESARGHGKTSIISTAMPIFELARNPNLRVRLIAQADSKARDRLGEIRRHIKTNPLMKLVFPELQIDESAEDSKHRLTLVRESRAKDPSIEAVGVLSSVTGGRSDLLILDDVVDMRNSILQPQMKEQVKQKVLAEWIPTLEPDGRIWVVNTPWTMDDILAYMKALAGYLVVSTPVGTDEDPFAPIWPEKWPREKLEAAYRELGSVEYDRAYRCVALSSDAVPVQPGWIKFYDAELLGEPWELFCLQSYDLAISLSKKADYFACVTLLYDERRNLVFVADAWRDRLSMLDQAVAVVDQATSWRPNRIVLEKVGYQGALAQYLQEHAQSPLPIWPFTPRGTKGRRLFEVTPLFQDGRVLFHPNLDPRVNPSVAQRGNIIGELLQFPLGAHDDMVDALTQGLIALRESFPSGDRERREGFESGDGISCRITLI